MATMYQRYRWALPALCLSFLFGCGGGGDGGGDDSDGSTPPPTTTNPTATWRWIDPTPQGYSLHQVIKAGDRYIAVGGNGTVGESSDGVNWTFRRIDTDKELSSIAWNGSLFVTVTRATSDPRTSITGAGKIFTSPDAITWTERVLGEQLNLLNAVVWAGSQFVALGDAGKVVVSLDGLNWTIRTEDAPAKRIHSMAWTSEKGFVAGGDESIYNSTDGLTWTRRAGFGSNSNIFQVVWDGARFRAVGSSPYLTSSEDGIVWGGLPDDGSMEIYLTLRDNPIQWILSAAAFGNELILTSWDGTVFSVDAANVVTHITDAPRVQALSMISEPGRLVGVGQYGTLATTGDATAWTLHSQSLHDGLAAFGNEWLAIARGDDTVIAVGEDGWIARRNSQGEWSAQQINSDYKLLSATWTGDRFIAGGKRTTSPYPGVVLASADGIVWDAAEVEDTTSLSFVAVAGNGTTIVACDQGGKIATSIDGVDWTVSRPGGTYRNLRTVTWAGDKFIAGGDLATIMTSDDGYTWASQTTPSLQPSNSILRTIAWGGGRIIAATFDGGMLASSDGVTWTKLEDAPVITKLRWGNDRFVALGERKLWSLDVNDQWQATDLPHPSLRDIQGMGTGYIAVGDPGIVIEID